nr:hypothetical protein Itr_chr08CG02840 [Ipomoea trifida]
MQTTRPPVCFAATAKATVNGVGPPEVTSTISFARFPAASADINSMHSGSTGFDRPMPPPWWFKSLD